MITAKFDVFLGPSGGVSLEAGEGRTLVAMAGNMIEDDVAEKLGLEALFEKKSAEKVETARKSSDPLGALADEKEARARAAHTPAKLTSQAANQTEVK